MAPRSLTAGTMFTAARAAIFFYKVQFLRIRLCLAPSEAAAIYSPANKALASSCRLADTHPDYQLNTRQEERRGNKFNNQKDL